MKNIIDITNGPVDVLTCDYCQREHTHVNIILTDDGTLDTVLRCTECGEEFRFTFYDDQAEDGESYDEYVQDRIDEIEAEHECPSQCCSHSYCTERTRDASGLCAGHRNLS